MILHKCENDDQIKLLSPDEIECDLILTHRDIVFCSEKREQKKQVSTHRQAMFI